MKLLIAADMEGITGVVDWGHVDPSNPEYGRFRHWMTADVNAAIRGAFNAGVDEVVVSDGHGGKTNLLIEELDPRARLNSGTGPLGMVQGVDDGVQAVFFIGYHARAGTPQAILCHTVSGRSISNVWINGQLVGEIGMNAATCGYYGAPVLLVSGDLAACREAQAQLEGVELAVTKTASGQFAAELLPPELTQARIEAAAETALRRYLRGEGPTAVKLETPVRYTIEFKNPGMTDRACLLPGSIRLDECKIEIAGDTPPLAYQYFRSAMRLGSK